MANVIFVLWFAALCFITDAQQYQLPDVPTAIDLTAKDVDDHLQLFGRQGETAVFIPAPSKHQAPSPGIAATFQEQFQKAVQDRLARLPSNVAYGGSSEATPSAYGGSSEATHPKSSYVTTVPIKTDASVTFSTESPVLEYSTQAPKKIHEDEYKTSDDSIRIGSAKGVPGVHFPGYTDIPLTSFTCSDKKYLPGFFADMETGCQVFHVCWPDRQESFLCPMGTTFNQALLACDNWYSSDCSLAFAYYDVNAEADLESFKLGKSDSVSSMINHLLEKSNIESTTSIAEDYKTDFATPASISSFISRYLPVKAKVVIHPETAGQRPKIVATASVGERHKMKQSKDSGTVSYVSGGALSEKTLKLSLGKDEKKQKPADIKHSIFAFRLNKALDNVLDCIKNDASVSRFYALVDSVVKLVKVISSSFQPEPYEPTPSGAMHEYDSFVRQSLDKLPVLVKDILINMATFVTEIRPNPARKVSEVVNVKRVPITHLNERFIIKPVIRHPAKQTASKVKPGTKTRRVVVAEPFNVSQNGRFKISSGTKKALLKNYANLINARSA